MLKYKKELECFIPGLNFFYRCVFFQKKESKPIIEDAKLSGINHDRSSYTFSYTQPINNGLFSDSDREVLDLIWRTYGNMTQWQLSDLSHLSPEWKLCEAQLADETGKNSVIVDTDLFFENFDDGHGLFLDPVEKMAAVRDFYHLFNR